MADTCIAVASLDFSVPPSKIWAALTDPTLVKQYFFGTDVITDWKVGSPIIYKGEWEGTRYEDRGNVLEIKENEKLVSNYWTSFSGLPDTPENYQNVTYELTPLENGTRLTITQDNVPSEDAKQHSQENWNMILQNMKKLIEE